MVRVGRAVDRHEVGPAAMTAPATADVLKLTEGWCEEQIFHIVCMRKEPYD
jgi:hypothetical protein